MAKAKLDKIAKMYHAASKPEKDKKEEMHEEMESKEGKKRGKKLDFSEGQGGMHITIYKDEE